MSKLANNKGTNNGFVRQCELCHTPFKSVKSHKRHMDQCHSSDGGPRHTCCICQRIFKRSDNLAAHYRSVHCGVKPNKCTKCGRGYRTRNELIKHNENCKEAKQASANYAAPAAAALTLPTPVMMTTANATNKSSVPVAEKVSVAAAAGASLPVQPTSSNKSLTDMLDLDDMIGLPSLQFDTDIMDFDSYSSLISNL